MPDQAVPDRTVKPVGTSLLHCLYGPQSTAGSCWQPCLAANPSACAQPTPHDADPRSAAALLTPMGPPQRPPRPPTGNAPVTGSPPPPTCCYSRLPARLEHVPFRPAWPFPDWPTCGSTVFLDEPCCPELPCWSLPWLLPRRCQVHCPAIWHLRSGDGFCGLWVHDANSLTQE